MGKEEEAVPIESTKQVIPKNNGVEEGRRHISIETKGGILDGVNGLHGAVVEGTE